MIAVVDLRRKGFGEDPPEIAALIQRFGGSIGATEKALKCGQGLISKIRTGRAPFTQHWRDRIQALMNTPITKDAKPMAIQKPTDVPENCPPLMGDLIRHAGNRTAAAKILGLNGPTGNFYEVLGGRRPIPEKWAVLAKVALGQPVMGPSSQLALEPEPQGPVLPEFVPWDGKTMVGASLQSFQGKPSKKIKLPPALAQLLAMHGGSRGRAAEAMGRTGGYLNPMIDDPKVKFKEGPQRAVHAALHGVKPPERNTMGEDYDKYTMELAIVFVKQTGVDFVQSIADILLAKMVFRKNTKTGWILMYRMATEDLPKFKKLAMRDADEVVCP